MNVPIHFAVLTVSDTAASDSNLDKSGPTIKQLLSEQGFQCEATAIVPDEPKNIRETVLNWTYKHSVDWIVITGGTGFGVRDQTPEVIDALLERKAPGLVHLMLSESLKHTAMAALSRPVAGTIKNTLVVTLPGSVKAVRENIQALTGGGIIKHATDLIRGGSGKDVHKTLAQSSTSELKHDHGHVQHPHHHHHHHDHAPPIPRTTLTHDPNAPVSTRQRSSPFPLLSFEEAQARVRNNLKALPIVTLPVNPYLRGYVLAQDVHAPQDVPSSSTTSVDGYALRSTDAPGTYEVVTPQTHKLRDVLPSGSIYRINTGAPLPAGTDTVIMVEDTEIISTLDDREEKEVRTLAQVPVGENVRLPGSDVKKGDFAIRQGTLITSGGGEIGTLAFVGKTQVDVYKKPVVAILSTGNELLDLQSPQPHNQDDFGGIWDTNRPSLQAALEGYGYEVIDLGIVEDQLSSHITAISQGLEKADILLTTGGTSMGPSDLLKPVIERYFEGTIHFGRVTLKPGKPTTFATIPINDISKPVFALPGNPASALVMFYVFVVPALRILGGQSAYDAELPRVKVELQSSMPLDSRTEFHRVVISANLQTGKLEARSTGGQRSSRVASLSGANGLVVLPQKKEGGQVRLEVGSLAEAILIGEIRM